MDWIDRLDEHGWNVIIDELAWHLREGRSPVLVKRVASPSAGVEFGFAAPPATFFPVAEGLLEEHWMAALEIALGFPELAHVAFRAEA